MTLVAATERNATVVMSGDIMLSWKIPGGERILFPLVKVDNSKTDGREAYAKSFTQKICIFDTVACLGWTGSLKSAQNAVSCIKEKVANLPRPVTVEAAETLGKEVLRLAQQLPDFDCIFYLRCGNDQYIRCQSAGAGPLEGVAAFDFMTAIGSGAGVFYSSCLDYAHLHEPAPEDNDLTGNIVPHLKALAVTVQSHIIFGTGIHEGWGGGFEIATLSPRGFEKLAPLIYMVFNVVNMPDGTLSLVLGQRVVVQYHHGDVTVFRSDSITSTENTVTVVSRPGEKTDPNDIPILDRFECTIAHFTVVHSGVNYTGWVAGGRAGPPPVVYDLSSNPSRFEFTQGYLDRLLDCAQQFGRISLVHLFDRSLIIS